MPRTLVVVSFVAIQGWCCSSVWANEFDHPRFSISGFGTIGASHSSERQADFTSSILKFSGAGYTREWSSDVDTRIGVQATLNATAQLSAVLQVIAEQRYDNSYTPIIEWANVKYQATPDFSVRVGRIALPNYLAADYRKVSYAIPWVRTPLAVYGLVPITNSDGIDASYRMHFGDVQNTIQAAIGRSDVKFKGDGTAKIRHLAGISNTIDAGFSSVRMTYLQGDLDIGLTRPLFDAFRQFGPAGIAIADRYDVKDKHAHFLGIGASYDPGSWFVMAEYGKLRTQSYLGDQSAWYVSGGRRYGSFTPYLGFARIKSDTSTYEPGLPAAVLPFPLSQVATGLNASLADLLANQAVHKNVTAGIRWDFMKNTSVKLQYDRIFVGKNSDGGLMNIQPGFRPGGSVHVFSIALDFVF